MSDFILMQGDEWQALYEDGKLIAQGHHLSVGDLFFAFAERGREILFESIEFVSVSDYGYGLGHDPATYPEVLDLAAWVDGPKS